MQEPCAVPVTGTGGLARTGNWKAAAMARRLRALIPFAIGTGCLVLASVVFITVRPSWRNGVVSDVHRMDAEALERDIRIGLPIGSSLSTVEDFLGQRGIEFSFDSSARSIYAVAHKLRGSTISASKSLQFQFRFDGALKLKSVDAKALYTGP